jgi:uncharacterized protein YjbJ (UPF0337 family)
LGCRTILDVVQGLIRVPLPPIPQLEFHNQKFNKEHIMSLKYRAKATAKNIEGKVQEAVGDLTGDPKAQAEGKEKQAEAKVRHIVENVKDEVKKIID